MKINQSRILVITGFSGAGKTVALRALEDAGFYCIDNFPPQILKEFIKLSIDGETIKNIAIGVDVREKSLLHGIEETINSLRSEHKVEVIFLEAERSVLIRRYKETRRPHPLCKTPSCDLQDAFEHEKNFLAPLKEMADRVIDTSTYTPHQLRSLIMESFGMGLSSTMGVILISFGYKFGIPQQVDILFDIRFLPNPYFVEELKDLTGLDQPVKDYISSSPVTDKLLLKLKDLLGFLITEYIKEGKTSLTIGIGCTGGKHRSPFIVEELNTFLTSNFELETRIIHREL
jgi:UPF0042 nucleotide-binding protein